MGWYISQIADVVAKLLSIIFKKSWQSGEVFSDWQKGKFIPIFKKYKKAGPSNYHRQWDCNLSKYVDDKTLSSAVHLLEGKDAIHRGLGRLEEWATVDLMEFSKFLHLGWGNLWHQHRQGNEWTESSPADSGILVDKKSDTSWQHVTAAQKANCILDCMKRSVTSRFTLRLWDLTWYTASSSGSLSIWMSWSRSREDPQKRSDGWFTSPVKKGWKSCGCSAWK